jgi:hypothetical protein
MSNQNEISAAEKVVLTEEIREIELSEEARVALALYLDVVSKGKVTKEGTKVPSLSTSKLSRIAEVSPKQVSKGFDRLRTKGFLSNDENGDLLIPDIIAFEDWLRLEGAVID